AVEPPRGGIAPLPLIAIAVMPSTPSARRGAQAALSPSFGAPATPLAWQAWQICVYRTGTAPAAAAGAAPVLALATLAIAACAAAAAAAASPPASGVAAAVVVAAGAAFGSSNLP